MQVCIGLIQKTRGKESLQSKSLDGLEAVAGVNKNAFTESIPQCFMTLYGILSSSSSEVSRQATA